MSLDTRMVNCFRVCRSRLISVPIDVFVYVQWVLDGDCSAKKQAKAQTIQGRKSHTPAMLHYLVMASILSAR